MKKIVLICILLLATSMLSAEDRKYDRNDDSGSLAPAGGCDYVTGDVNGSESYNGLDVIWGVNYFKGGQAPLCSCEECTPGIFWYICGDVNASCSYNGLDITYGVNYFKGISPSPMPCADCPPVG